MRGLIRTGGGGSAKETSLMTPGTYSADLTMDADGESLALADGTKKVYIVNQGVTTEDLRVAFGTTAADAITNLAIVAAAATTGYYLPSNVDVPNAGIVTLGVPSGANFIACAPGTAGDTQAVSIVQGV